MATLLHNLQQLYKSTQALYQIAKGECPYMKKAAKSSWDTATEKLEFATKGSKDPGHLIGAGDFFLKAYHDNIGGVRRNIISNIVGADEQAEMYRRAMESALMAAFCYALRGGKGDDVNKCVSHARSAYGLYRDAEVQSEHFRLNSAIPSEGPIFPISCPTPKTKNRLDSEKQEVESAISRL
ncbi:hypothetical protein [Streptomyces sp. NPDC127108]|uniref:hypothetical protein n=1 Tax=Streptomyces sp. NPDC127108 TaxID=3345361 RepID=UPI003632C80F